MLYGLLPTSHHHITDGASMPCHLRQDHAGFNQTTDMWTFMALKKDSTFIIGSVDLNFHLHYVVFHSFFGVFFLKSLAFEM